jgi:hypothetical protein
LQEQGRGVLLYLRQEGRGIGLAKKISAYALQEQGLDTVEANLALGLPEDMRDYRGAAEMLLDLGVRKARLLTNNPAKVEGLQRYGVEVVERLPLGISPNPSNLGYLRTKREKMGHLFPMAVALEVVREVSAQEHGERRGHHEAKPNLPAGRHSDLRPVTPPVSVENEERAGCVTA